MSTPGEAPAAAPVITGTPAPKVADAKPQWTAKQLKAAKPLMVYYFVEADRAVSDADYDFAKKVEIGAFSDDIVTQINKAWIAKRVAIAGDADHKQAKFQARLEFYAFTGQKLDSITQKEQAALSGTAFANKLKEFERKNRDFCDAELKKLEAQTLEKKETASR